MLDGAGFLHALGVLVTTVIVLLAAGTLTVAIQRAIRARQERRATTV